MRFAHYLLPFLFLISNSVSGRFENGGFPVESDLATPPPAHYEILFMGNSHSSANDLPNLVATLISAGVPQATAQVDLAPGMRFLSERLNDGVSLPTLNSRTWTHVVLQAQKYSTTGKYFYPTDAAEEWIRRAKSQAALPIMFPEWPRRGNTEEGPRIHQLHLDMASRERACVAPIGLAWEESIARNPSLALHAVDGNHSNPTGALLTAYVLYQVITGHRADELPYLPRLTPTAETQRELAGIASLTVDQHQAVCISKVLSTNVSTLDFTVSGEDVAEIKNIILGSSGIFDVDIESIQPPDSPFQLDPGSCLAEPLSLAPEDSCALEVGFFPEQNGRFTGSIEISTSFGSTEVHLTGTSSGLPTVDPVTQPIHAGMADAWYDPATAGQGFFVTVYPDIEVVFLAWFTYDAERPGPDDPATLGEPGHRWLTAQGSYSNGIAVLNVVMTSGGVFDRPEPAVENDAEYGTMTIEWEDCEHATLNYDIEVPDLQGTIELQRLAPDRVRLCEALSGP